MLTKKNCRTLDNIGKKILKNTENNRVKTILLNINSLCHVLIRQSPYIHYQSINNSI